MSKIHYCRICNSVTYQWFCCDKRTIVYDDTQPVSNPFLSRLQTLEKENTNLKNQLREYADHILSS